MINHDQLPAWIPGKMVASSEGLGWKGVSFRHYDYKPTTVDVPAMSEFLVIEYVSGHTRLDRNVEGQWKASDCYPGDLTLLTRSRSSQWHWTGSVGVRHAYITGDFLVDVADEVLDKQVSAIDFEDVLSVRNPQISACMAALADESCRSAFGGDLFAESVGTQLAIHLLRDYAEISLIEQTKHNEFSKQDARRIKDLISDRLTDPPSLLELSQMVHMGRWSFTQRFRATFGCQLPQYVLQQKVSRARDLVVGTNLPLKQVAFSCGFSDQAHMTRSFKRVIGVAPSVLRGQH